MGLAEVADVRVTAVPTGQGRLVELGRALACEPKVLLLDEPAAGQDDTETHRFAELLRQLASEGVAVILVEHDMKLVMKVCDVIHVLNYGRMLAVGTPREIQAHDGGARGVPRPDRRAGVSTDEPLPPPAVGASIATEDDPLLELRGVRAAYDGINVLHGVDLTVPEGCVVAVLGPNGAGKTTTLRVAAGLHPPTGGDVLIAGRRVNGASPDDLARSGLCLIPEGRGIFPNLTVRENLWMMSYAGTRLSQIEEVAFARFPRLRDRRRQVAGTLSGGEQQMLALARGLTTDPALLILDELSMGLAPLVVEELFALVGQVAAEGVAILVVEQFANVVLDVADLAAVMLGGRIVRSGSPSEVAESLSEAYLGG